MVSLGDAVENLGNVVKKAKASKRKSEHGETVGQIASYLIFLKSSTISSETANKLAEVLRRRLPTVYPAFPKPAFELAAALCETIYTEKIVACFTASKHEQKARWESVLNALLSGILDHLDEPSNEARKETIGVSLHATLCSMLFSNSITQMSTELRCTGYSVLSESAGGSKANQKRLLDEEVLGGAKLGSVLWRTRDYLVLESILNLFARMIPPSGSTAAGRSARKAFIRSVFVDSSPGDVQTAEKLANMVEHVASPEWDKTALAMVDTLAASDLAFPQPFEITEVTVDRQSKASDRLYVDEHGFTANVLIEDDLFDSLIAPYASISAIKVSSKSSATLIRVVLTSAPLLGHHPLHNSTQDDTSHTLEFTLKDDDVHRFHASLDTRGVGDKCKRNKSHKHSLLAAGVDLEIDLAGVMIAKKEMDQRLDNFSQIYPFDDPSDEQADDLLNTTQYEEIPCINPALLTIHPPTTMSATTRPGAQTSPGDAAAPVDHVSESAAPPSAIAVPAVPAPALVSSIPALAPAPPASAAVSSPAPAAPVVSAPAHAAPSISVPGPGLAPPVTPIRQTASQLLRDSAFGTSIDDLSEAEDPPSPPKLARKPASDSILTKDAKGSAPSVKLAKGKVLDSDDEVPGSTPSKPPVKKKAVVVSDDEDEIEDVVSSSKPAVSRRRSVLAMTAVTPSMASTTRRQAALSTSASFVVGRNSGKLGARTRSAAAKDVDVIDLDSDEEPYKGPAVNNPGPKADAVPGPHHGAENVVRDSDDITAAHKQVRMSSPPVQPLRKAVKSALRKKNQPVDDAPPEPMASKVAPRKRKAEVNVTELEDPGPATKRPKVDHAPESPPPGATKSKQKPKLKTRAESPVFKTPGTAKKQYRRKKGERSSPATPSPPSVNYDEIPDARSSAVKEKATKPAPKPTKKKEEKPAPEEKRVGANTRATRSTAKKSEKTGTDASASTKTPTTVAADARAEEVTPEERPLRRKSPRLHGSVDPMPQAARASSDIHQTSDFDQVVSNPSPAKPPSKSKPVEQTSTKKSKKAPWDNFNAKPVSPILEPAPMAEDLTAAIPERIESVTHHSDDNFNDPDVTLLDPIEIDEKTVASKVGIAKEQNVEYQEPNQAVAYGTSPIGLNEVVNEKQDYIAPPVLAQPTHVTEVSDSPAVVPRKKLEEDDVQERQLTFASSTTLGASTRNAPPPTSTTSRITQQPRKPRQTVIQVPQVEPRREDKELPHVSHAPDMTDIANALTDIQQAILHKITSNVEGVRYEVRRGRDMLLADAASDLMEMRAESIDQYNHLIELEAEYASFGRKLSHALDDLTVANRNVHTDIEKIIQAHDRGSIVKHIPKSLFGGKLPASIQRYRT